MATIRVLLAEDHTVVRQGLKRILQTEPGIEIVAEVGDGRAALEALQNARPDIAVVDISLPNLSGIEVTRQAARLSPATRVLILSMHADDQDLLKAVLAVNAGGSYFSPVVSRVVLDGYLQETEGDADELAVLSPREREVLPLIAEGHSNKEVAQILDLSVSTVESHRKRIMEKLDLHNTAALVRFAVRKGLVQ